MANVHIRIGFDESDGMPSKVVVDGVDLTKHILAEGFGVDLVVGPGMRHSAVVTMRLKADRLDLDLPESVLDAIATPRPTSTEV